MRVFRVCSEFMNVTFCHSKLLLKLPVSDKDQLRYKAYSFTFYSLVSLVKGNVQWLSYLFSHSVVFWKAFSLFILRAVWYNLIFNVSYICFLTVSYFGRLSHFLFPGQFDKKTFFNDSYIFFLTALYFRRLFHILFLGEFRTR